MYTVRIFMKCTHVCAAQATGLQIYGGPGSLSHDFKIWPITFQGVSENHYCTIRSFSRLKTCNNVFEIEHFFQIKDLRHPDDTSIRVTADGVNFVTNAEYVYCT